MVIASLSHPNCNYRGARDKWFAFTLNGSTEANAIECIIGNENTLAGDVERMKTYTTTNPEAMGDFESFKKRAIELVDYMNIATLNGIKSEKSIKKLKELQQNPIFKHDPMFIEIDKELKDKGFI